MNKRATILIAFAVCLGLVVAGLGVQHFAQTKPDTPRTGSIYIAQAKIKAGEELTLENMKLESWPAERIPEGALTRSEQINDVVAQVRLHPGEPLTSAKLNDRKAYLNATRHPTLDFGHHRVVSIKVSTDVTSIMVHDFVDLVVIDPDGGKPATILENVQVFSKISCICGPKPIGPPKTISVIVTKSQAEVLYEFGRMKDSVFQIKLRKDRPQDLICDLGSKRDAAITVAVTHKHAKLLREYSKLKNYVLQVTPHEDAEPLTPKQKQP